MTDIYRVMNAQHPITPPPELVQQWETEAAHTTKDEMWHIAVQAARWGADEELKALCQLLYADVSVSLTLSDIRAARRPKPPSLKEQALKILATAGGSDYPTQMTVINTDEHILIKRALEALPND